jgi:LysM repeat protein
MPLGGYQVVEGDTLSAIARRFGVPLADILEMNGLSDADLLRPGWVLQLDGPSFALAAATEVRSARPAEPPGRTADVYVVREGDTLSRIAERLQVDLQALAGANSLGPDSIIRVGQVLRFTSSVRPYVVQPGDTLSSIADRHGSSTEALLRLNSLADPHRIAVGQTLRVR